MIGAASGSASAPKERTKSASAAKPSPASPTKPLSAITEEARKAAQEAAAKLKEDVKAVRASASRSKMGDWKPSSAKDYTVDNAAVRAAAAQASAEQSAASRSQSSSSSSARSRAASTNQASSTPARNIGANFLHRRGSAPKGNGWYYEIQGNIQGPVDAAQIETLVNQGTLTGSNRVWVKGMADWARLDGNGPR